MLILDYIAPFILNKNMRLNFLTLYLILFSSLSFGQPTTWNSSISYSTGDLVVSGTSTYIAVQDVPVNQQPPNTTYWGDLATAAASLGVPTEQVPDLSTDSILASLPNAAPDQNSSSSSSAIKIFSISTRAYYGPNGMSGSLNMTGNANDPKKVMFRVKGPSMNLSGAKLSNPSMDVKSRSVSATSWTDEFVSTDFGDHESATGPYKDRATGNNLEPMVVTSLTPSVYGCVVGSENGGQGNAIIEIYSLDDDTSSSYFTSLSTRGYYGANGMSGSVNLVGTGKMKVMFRVKGPSMNIGGTKLADPNLTLFHSVPNDDTADPNDTKWAQVVKSSTFLSYSGEDTSYTNLTSSYTDRHTGNNLEPMLVYELSQGIYGCVVGSDNGGQGNAIIEIYSLE